MDEEERPSIILPHLIDGYEVSQAIHVAATLGIADVLAECSCPPSRPHGWATMKHNRVRTEFARKTAKLERSLNGGKLDEAHTVP